MKSNPRYAHRNPHFIELLESRHAPAVIIAAGGHSATYTDSDGDHVTITLSSGTLTPGLFATAVNGLGEQLHMIDLSAGGGLYPVRCGAAAWLSCCLKNVY